MRHLNNIRGALPSASLMLHYVMIALLLCTMGAGVVWYSHVEKIMASVDMNAKQVTGLADRLRSEVPDSPEVDAKITCIQLESNQIQSTARSVMSKATVVK